MDGRPFSTRLLSFIMNNSNERIITLEHIKKGDIIFVEAYSQCGSTATITVEGGLSKPISLAKTTGSCDLTRLEGEHYSAEKTDDSPVQLKISINTGSKMKVIKTGTILSDIDGIEKGLQFTFCIEDSTDNDFNDYFITVVAFHKKN